MTWVVARTQPRRERWAAENITRQGACPYMPRYSELAPSPTISGRLIRKELPLFPSYIFVKLMDGRWRFLLGTFGLMGLIMGTDGPTRVPEHVIAELRKREGPDGMIRLPPAPVKRSRFTAGKAIRVIRGPFQGRVGIYQGSTAAERERVLLNVLGRLTPVLIGEELLEVA